MPSAKRPRFLFVRKRKERKKYPYLGGYYIDPKKNITERKFIRFILKHHGAGFYSILRQTKKGFRRFWFGIIEKDKFIRLRGRISRYLIPLHPSGVWHSL